MNFNKKLARTISALATATSIGIVGIGLTAQKAKADTRVDDIAPGVRTTLGCISSGIIGFEGTISSLTVTLFQGAGLLEGVLAPYDVTDSDRSGVFVNSYNPPRNSASLNSTLLGIRADSIVLLEGGEIDTINNGEEVTYTVPSDFIISCN